MPEFIPLEEGAEEFDFDPTTVAEPEPETAGLEDEELEVFEKPEIIAPEPAEPGFTPLADKDIPADEPGFFENLVDEALGVVDLGVRAVSGAAGEVLGGFGGLAKTITSGPEEGEKTLRGIQEAVSFGLGTEEGDRNIAAIGEAMNNIADLDDQDPIPIVRQLRFIFGSGLEGKKGNPLGNFMAEVARDTGSPTLEAFAGAFGATLGPGVLELLGFKGAGKLGRGAGMRAKKAADRLAFGEMAKAMPSPRKYQEIAKGVFRETDALGATVAPEAIPKLAKRVRQSLADGGYRPDVNPIGPIEKLLKKLDSNPALNTADMNELGRAMARMGEQGSHQQALGLGIASEFNDFMSVKGAIQFPKGTPKDVQKAYKIARKMYGQGKRSEAIEKMVEFASSEGKDFIQTMNTQMNALVKNQIFGKGQGRFFSRADRAIMERMMADSRPEKWLQNLAKLSPFRSNAGGLAQIVATAIGTGVGVGTESIAAGGVVAGIPLALGEGARIWGEQIFKSKIKLGAALMQAGTRGKRIAKAYVENIPKKQRSPQDLGRLLSDPLTDLSDMPKTKFTLEAMKFADQRRKELLAAGAAAASTAAVPDEAP